MVKRSSPGAEEQKSPLANVELGDEDAQKLREIQRDLARAEIVLGMLFAKLLISLQGLINILFFRTPGSGHS